MPRRTRKLVGTLAIFMFVLVYGPLAMALAESRILEAPRLVQTLAYAADPLDGAAGSRPGVIASPQLPIHSERAPDA